MNYTYTLTLQLNSTADIIVHANGVHCYTMNRVYSNGLKKLLDGYFDYRYFLMYDVRAASGQRLAHCKKVQRKGRLWFEAVDEVTQQSLIINYENWRVGIPELFIKGQGVNIKIDKEMEGWSNFLVEDEVIARWLAVYREQDELFEVTFEVIEESIHPAVLLAIAQTTLFIGA